MFKKLKEKKGFTLVELIVVLVILAILAALLIPALTGYINKAKDKQIIAETRQTVMAAQTLVDEEYAGLDLGTTTAIIIEPSTTAGTSTDKKVTTQEIADLAEVAEANIIKGTVNADGKVTELVYSTGGKTCKYENKQYTVTKGATTRTQP